MDTPLHLASQFGYTKIVQELIQNGANINLQNKQNNTPLHLACQNNQGKVIELLLSQKNIQKNQKNSKKQLAMQLITHFKLLKLFNLYKKIVIQDFEIIGLIGRGSFGEVFLVSFQKEQYALKVIEKDKIIKKKLQKKIITERDVLSQTNHPFIIKLYYAFQTQDKLLLVLQYACQGDLGKILNKYQKFSEQEAKLYLTEIILALEHLHERDIIYRDLKPENIVIDQDGHAILTDFGLSKEGVMDPYTGGQSFCGSVYYLPPEMFTRKQYGKAIDWYSLGVVFYEMLTGKLPFDGQTQESIFALIRKGKYTIPKDISKDCRNLISGLMEINPDLRLGSKGAYQIKNHQFFKGVIWNNVYKKQNQMPKFNNCLKVKTFYNQIEINHNIDSTQNIKGWSFSYQH